MHEDFYRNVLSRLREEIKEAEAVAGNLQNELARATSRLADLRRAAHSFASLLGETESEASPATELDPNPQALRHADVAYRVLRTHGEPMRVPDIAEKMAETGHPLPPDQRIRDSAVFSALRRRPQDFTRVGRGLWALKEWNLPEPPNQDDLHFDESENQASKNGID